MKLIKLTDTHYVIVDDSEIKQNDYYLNTSIPEILFKKEKGVLFHHCKKITHSTHCLKCGSYDFNSVGDFNNTSYECNDCDNKWEGIKPLSISEVEEAISGYSVEKMAEQEYIINCNGGYDLEAYKAGFEDAINAHKEHVKDKLFTVEDMRKAYEAGMVWMGEYQNREYSNDWMKYPNEKDYIQSLLPKTEWECTFDEQGKLKLIKNENS